MNERERVEIEIAMERLDAGEANDRGPMVLAAAIFLLIIILALAGIAAGFISAIDMASRSITP